MAQKAKNLDGAINKIMKNYRASLTKAMRYASAQATEDIYKKAMTCLDEYYANYEPNSYDRSETLWRAFVPYSNIRSNKESIISTVGVLYDGALLDVYAQGIYEGSKKYGQAEGIWIIENYLAGIHPGTDGSIDYNPSQYGQIDDISPTQKMNEYLNKYTQTFTENVYAGLLKQL